MKIPALLIILLAAFLLSGCAEESLTSNQSPIQTPSQTSTPSPTPTPMPTPISMLSGSDGRQTRKVTKILEGAISGYSCEEYCDGPCYLTITDKEGNEHTGSCWARPCTKWNDKGMMPNSYKGRRVRATLENETEYDSEGKDQGAIDSFTKIQFLTVR